MQRSNKKVESFYKSKAWKEARQTYIMLKNGLCERCKVKGIEMPANYVHHKEYITATNIDDANITLNYDNFELLCFSCHQEEHFPKQDEYKFDENGELIPPISSNKKVERENGEWASKKYIG